MWRLDMMRLIQATLDNLPGRYGDVLEWNYVDGLSVKEIADQLDVGLRSARLVEKVRGFTRRALFNRSTTSRV